jgi:hypothetical protein
LKDTLREVDNLLSFFCLGPDYPDLLHPRSWVFALRSIDILSPPYLGNLLLEVNNPHLSTNERPVRLFEQTFIPLDGYLLTKAC